MSSGSRQRPVVLLVAEAVTLAHFARIAALSHALEGADCDVVIASDPRYARLDPQVERVLEPLRSISPERFQSALARARPVYDAPTLTRYVEDDRELLRRVQPDLVIGDFRLSLSISAPLHGVRYAAVANAYWSPYAKVSYPVPDMWLTRAVGVTAAQALFNLARPMAFAAHAIPLARTRRHFGLEPLDGDIRTAYTWGDYTLYADIPDWVPMGPAPATCRFIGPPLWSPVVPLPEWWTRLPVDRPVIFLSLGSSGRATLVPEVAARLAQERVSLIIATAGRVELPLAADNVFVAPFVPLAPVIRRCDAVICNGGSLMTYQALAAGVPLVGVCSNMDQLLNMQMIESRGAGVALRASKADGEAVSRAAMEVLNGAAYRDRARAAQAAVLAIDSGARFREFVAEVTHVDVNRTASCAR